MKPEKPLPRIDSTEKARLMSSPTLKFPLSSTKYYIFCLAVIANSLHNTQTSYPQSLETYLLASPYNFSSFEYNVFYGIYSFPNLLFPLFVGIYTDKRGYSSILVLFLILQAIFGLIIIMCGSYNASFYLMVLGRLMLGLGMESIAMIIKKMIIQISKKNESVAFWGVFLSSNRLGGLISSYIPTLIYGFTQSITYCFFIALIFAILCSIFLLLALILINKTNLEKETVIHNEEDAGKSIFKILLDFKKETPSILWVSYAACSLNFMVYFGFLASENDFLMNAGSLDSTESSLFIVIFCVICFLAQPVIGYVFSKLGYYIFAFLVGAFLSGTAFSLFLNFYGTEDPEILLIPLSLFAIGYAFCTTFVYSFAGLVVHPKNYGLAYGLLQSTYNFGGLFGTLVFGIIKDQTTEYNGYFWALVETVTLEIFVGIMGIFILVADSFTTKILSSKA